MNLVQRQIFGNKAAITYNTYIGGVASTISTAALLATKLDILVGAISNFTVVGSDIKCKITGSYVIPSSAFTNNPNITYYRDSGICTSFDSNTFGNAGNLIYIELPSVTSISYNYGFINNHKLSSIYIPKCIAYGSTVGNDFIFEQGFPFKERCIIYTHPSMATINSGGVEGDLAKATTKTGIVRYVTSYVAPSPVTTLTAGAIYNNAIQLNFTPPSSTNPIDYYECWSNGVRKNNISASGQYIKELLINSVQNIVVYAVDIFYNKSIVSNSLTTSTANNVWDIATELVSYYKLDSNSSDYFDENNGIDTSITYFAGKVGNAASFNGTSSFISIQSSAFDFFGPSNLTKNCWFKLNNLPSTRYDVSSIQDGETASTQDKSLYVYPDGSVAFYAYDGAIKVCRSAAGLVAINTWYMLTGTFDGTNLKVYLNGILRAILATSSTFNSNAPKLVLGHKESSSNYFNGYIDELNIYKMALTQTQIDLLYNSGNGTTL
jgi:hypothetical protein